jgi:hypothetical protein
MTDSANISSYDRFPTFILHQHYNNKTLRCVNLGGDARVRKIRQIMLII